MSIRTVPDGSISPVRPAVSISPLSSTAPFVSPVVDPAAVATQATTTDHAHHAHHVDPAPPSGLVPNPRIEFDPKLGIAVLEYQDSATHSVAYYPAVAREDFSAPDWTSSA